MDEAVTAVKPDRRRAVCAKLLHVRTETSLQQLVRKQPFVLLGSTALAQNVIHAPRADTAAVRVQHPLGNASLVHEAVLQMQDLVLQVVHYHRVRIVQRDTLKSVLKLSVSRIAVIGLDVCKFLAAVSPLQ